MRRNSTNVSSWNRLLGGQTAKLNSTEELKCDLNYEMLGKHGTFHYSNKTCTIKFQTALEWLNYLSFLCRRVACWCEPESSSIQFHSQLWKFQADTLYRANSAAAGQSWEGFRVNLFCLLRSFSACFSSDSPETSAACSMQPTACSMQPDWWPDAAVCVSDGERLGEMYSIKHILLK